ncbi:AzlD family protein [Sphingobium vermicomposti]|uniref:Putative membrane protein n=1 Tax=Sphingobium vermicomposti TaxID=529005 RepID=A0A846MAT8_9SPHN|nr:AzlD domain-containing protein [Sphingobium vermicomposti]NIJ17941.1 putative membrane protein [Sphingobium vermicomposti]
MTINNLHLVTILLMALATYATRVIGYAALSNRTLSARTRAVLDAAPACVLLAVIAPAFVAPKPADVIALAITVVAATRLPMIATVTVAMVASASLRWLTG